MQEIKRLPVFKGGKFDIDTAEAIRDYLVHKLNIKLHIAFIQAQGSANRKTREIKVPVCTTAEKFMVTLHEIGHIAKSKGTKKFITEYKAEQYALTMARKTKLPEIYIKAYERRAKGYVLGYIVAAYCRGLKVSNIAPEIVCWLGIDFSEWEGCKILINNSWTSNLKKCYIMFLDKETNRHIKTMTLDFI